MKELAIIIPAYKAKFFRETLASIANQSNKNFHLYIGNDASPENLDDIVDEFKCGIDLTYVVFDENLGAKDLVAQWERCIDLSSTEDWIWLFSDDDVMAPNCVEEFYKAIEKDKEPYLYHFNVDVINENGERIEGKRYFPHKLSSVDFLMGKMSAQYRSYVVEYIFNRKSFQKCGGFPKFDLAWNSDDAMWFQLAKKSLIKTIPIAKVFWRASGINISRIRSDKVIAERKLIADLTFLQWLKLKLDENTKEEQKLKKQLIYWFFNRLNKVNEHVDESVLRKLKHEFHQKIYPNSITISSRLKVMLLQSWLYQNAIRIKKSIFS